MNAAHVPNPNRGRVGCVRKTNLGIPALPLQGPNLQPNGDGPNGHSGLCSGKEGGLQSLEGLVSSMQRSTHMPHSPVRGFRNIRNAGKGKAAAYEAQNRAGRFNGELGEPKP